MITEEKSLTELFTFEQERCRELLTEYRKIGPHGAFGTLHISNLLRRADQAVMSGDVVAMLHLYE